MTSFAVRLSGSISALAGASALQALLAVALLPLATVTLDAADLGAYALLMSIVGLAVAISDGGGALALPAHFETADDCERRRMIATFAAISGGLGLAVGGFMLAAWPLKAWLLARLQFDLHLSVWIACAAMVPLRALSATATVVFAVSDRGPLIAAQLAGQAVATFIVTVVALLLFNFGVLSLFLGVIGGQIVGLVIAGRSLGISCLIRPSRRWALVALANAPTAATAGLVDGMRTLAENAVLSRSGGLKEVAYYSHARLYYGIGLAASNALAQNLWATSLAEARTEDRMFRRTGPAWEAAHLIIVFAGLGAVALGDEIVTYLTNGVLAPAADYLPWLIILLLINLSGRASLAALFAVGQGASITWFRTGLSLATIATLPVVVSDISGFGLSLGIGGLVGICVAEALVYRLVLRHRAAALGSLPFQDFWAVTGTVAIGAAAVARARYQPSIEQELIALVALLILAVVVDWLRGGPVQWIVALRSRER